ncbi:hypothetical protein ACNQ13_01490 [Mycoplasma sp. VS428]|uniref:hypothetical protein n=1 Tax=Mycoplasma sp. VS428 TaxID=3401684 RepID=UPI003AAAA8B3
MRSVGNIISSQIYQALKLEYKPPYWYQIIEENTDALFFKQANPNVFSRYLNNDVIVINFDLYFIADALSHIEQLNTYKLIYEQLAELKELKDFTILAKAINNIIIDNNSYITQADNIVNVNYDTTTQSYLISYELLIQPKQKGE